ncbi:hypothetical protein PHAVU_004G063500 [Phaseolus vulgaris]|uniref:DDT domain-containing protein n=1 Tax=Phaseolus vulgaris TaxID=3885 RepID=V7C2W5_PHAVU|nr:hypothetical protein PHAVU_004G063500g [Phaseolus vulgaris]ESW23630.1 hypothetical protein PHAVU_004G063500g [Phaseolus vulgaris]
MAITAISNSNIEPGFSSAQQKNMNLVAAGGKKPKRCNSPGVRIVGSRIYDSANGKTCHQCRQKTMDFAASCKNSKNGKPCPIKFCQKCLMNRYGENAEEVEKLDNWACPKCRNFCNCSFCRKKRGELPTGQLFHTAKATGFKSVSEMLVAKTSVYEEEHKHDQVLASKVASSMKPIASEKELVVFLSGEMGKENSSERNSSLKLDPVNTQKTSTKICKKAKREELKEISNGKNGNSAGKKKCHKRRKICEEVPNEEKGNANNGTKACNKVSERETKVDTKKLLGTDAEGKSLSGVQIPEHRNHHLISVDPANDFILPMTSAPKQDMQHMNAENCNSTVPIDSCAGAKVQLGIARFASVDMNLVIDKTEEEIHLPPAAELTKILEIELPPENVGDVLQLLEFCRLFGKALDLKKGEAEAILRELVRKQNLRRGQNTLAVQFQIRMLTLILADSENESPSLTIGKGSNSWLKALKDLLAESDHILKDFPLDWLEEGTNGYYNLDLSLKLTLLKFLCDEALGTSKLRSCIEDQNSRHAEDVKEAKSKVAEAMDKEKDLRKQLKNEMVKTIMLKGTPLRMEKRNALLAKLKGEVVQAHDKVLKLKGVLPKEKRDSHAIRIKPEFLDNDGKIFWKLKSYNNECTVLLQDINIQDTTLIEEKWFVYGPEKTEEVDKYISSRTKRLKSNKVSHMLLSETSL